MAVHKAIRSNSPAQHKAQLQRRRPNPQFKAELFDNLRQINRGYGVAIAALRRLQHTAIFPGACLRDFSDRTEALRALVNRDLLRLLAGHEDQDTAHFTRKPRP